jgi:hypothetical protein
LRKCTPTSPSEEVLKMPQLSPNPIDDVPEIA